MTRVAAIEPETSRAINIWPHILVCICALMVATISPPEDLKAGMFGTASLLPPALMKLLKIVGRGSAILILSYSFYLVWTNPRRCKSVMVLLPLTGFTMFAFCSIAWSASKGTSLGQVATFATLVALAHLIATIWSGERDTSRLLMICSIVLFVISLGLLFLHFVRPNLGVLTRSSSGIFHSTNAGATASLGIVILFASRIIWGWSWTRWLIFPATTVHMASLLIGANRLSLAVMVLVCAILFLTMSHKVVVAVTGLVFSSGLLGYACIDPGLVLFDRLAYRIGDFTSQGQSQAQLTSLSGRSEMWQKVWDSYLESPLLGHGYFMTSNTGQILVWDELGNWTAHNLGLQLLATLGVVGAVLFVVGIGSVVIRVIFQLGVNDKSIHQTAVFLLAIFLWFAGWGLLNASILGPLQPESVIFAVVLGLGAAISIRPSSSAPVNVPSSLRLTDGETR